jgi:protein O-GlcNAc transferase
MQLSPDQLFQRAFTAHQRGQLQAAVDGYRTLLQSQPGHFDAWHMLGVAALQGGDSQAAAQAIERALQLQAGVAPAWQNLAAAYRGQGQYAKAATSLARKIALTQADAASLTTLAELYELAGDPEAGLRTWDQLAHLTPHDPQAWVGKGSALRELRRPGAALACFEQALKLAPGHLRAANNRAITLQELERPQEALQAFDALLAREPGYAPAHNARALALWRLQRLAEAEQAYCQAIECEPGYAEAWSNRGALRATMARTGEAMSDLQKAISLQPARAETHNALGTLLAGQRRYDAAIASYQRALALQPQLAQAHGNLGAALVELGQIQQALNHFEQAIAQQQREPAAAASAVANRSALHAQARNFEQAAADARLACALNPDQPHALGNALYFEMMQADWRDHAQRVSELLLSLTAGHDAATPFVAMTIADDPALLLKTARRYVATHLPADPPEVAQAFKAPEPAARIRLAWCSADFHNHATAFLIAGLVEHLDQRRFETFALSYGPSTGDAYQQRLQRAFSHFIDVRGLSDQAIALRLRELNIDIAIDLKGYTNAGRPHIFNQRTALVQVSYLAYPGTSGLPLMDYLIADSVIVPPGEELHYSEAVVRLPDSYQANDDQRAIAPRTYSRAELQLPEDAFVFCSFNNTYKITPTVFDVWMRLLHAVPGSVLWLLQDNPAVSTNLSREAEARGVASQRLVFAPRLPTEDHLARHAAADLFLDTWPVNAHTTASDALWAGLSLVTLPGRSFAARVAASLLHAAGAPECVAADVAAYESLAIELARDPKRLLALGQKLRDARRSSALFDTRRYARHLEAAFTQMTQQARAGLPPASFTVGRIDPN